MTLVTVFYMLFGLLAAIGILMIIEAIERNRRLNALERNFKRKFGHDR